MVNILFVRSFIRSLARSLVRSFIHSFIGFSGLGANHVIYHWTSRLSHNVQLMHSKLNLKVRIRNIVYVR